MTYVLIALFAFVAALLFQARGLIAVILSHSSTLSGDYDGARHAVEATARRIRGYAGRDPELRAILADLESQVQELGVPMEEMSRKRMYAQASFVMSSREPDGKARRDAHQQDS